MAAAGPAARHRYRPLRVRRVIRETPEARSLVLEVPAGLAARYPGRLAVDHHEDLARGLIGHGEVTRVAREARDADYYICGPGGFMDTVEAGLRDLRVDQSRV